MPLQFGVRSPSLRQKRGDRRLSPSASGSKIWTCQNLPPIFPPLLPGSKLRENTDILTNLQLDRFVRPAWSVKLTPEIDAKTELPMASGSNKLKPIRGEEKPVSLTLKDFGISGGFRLVATTCGIYGDIYLGRVQNTEISLTIPNKWGSDASGSQFFHGSQNFLSFVSKFTDFYPSLD